MKINKAAALGAVGVLSCVFAVPAAQAQAQIRISGLTTTLASQNQTSQTTRGIDFANAKPMALPGGRVLPPSQEKAVVNALDPLQVFGAAAAEYGAPGTGERHSIQIVNPQDIPQGSPIEPQEFGTSAQPFTTSQANALADLTVNYYPYRAAGKLFFNIGNASYLCSASLIKPGIVVTAAHCVANYGQRRYYSGWTYVPAYSLGLAPYGAWTAASATVLTAYYDGTDNCTQYGVICPDDVAVITLNPQNGYYAGHYTGWFAYGWNGYSYNSSS
jgi:hypothetical protein